MTESSASPKVPKMQRSKWQPSHFPLGEGQEDYSIVDDLVHRTMNITLPQLVALSSQVRRELQQSISTRKSKRSGKVCNVFAMSEDIDYYPRMVDMIIDNCRVKNVCVDGGVACNVMVSRIMNALNLKCSRKSSTRIKVADGRRLHTHGVIKDLPITVNDVTTTVNFYW